VSTIYVDYSEYEKKQRGGFAGLLFKMLSPDLIEYVKVIARCMVGKEKVLSISFLFLGQKKAIRKIINKASLLLPNSYSEYNRLVRHYGTKQRYKVIPNAIDPELFIGRANKVSKEKYLILCVGRVEGRKNQLNLIKAVNNSPYKLVIIGAPASNQASYFEACKRMAATNIEFIHNLPQPDLLEYYSKAAVHVLPSWFETTGLSSLEAAVMGCNIVVTDKGDTREYFEDMAYYCDPASPLSIRKAVDEAANKSFNEALRTKILSEYIWPLTARKTFDAYKEVLYQ
jgi:glycosyltransferase involved in cell wall biosynthesis